MGRRGRHKRWHSKEQRVRALPLLTLPPRLGKCLHGSGPLAPSVELPGARLRFRGSPEPLLTYSSPPVVARDKARSGRLQERLRVEGGKAGKSGGSSGKAKYEARCAGPRVSAPQCQGLEFHGEFLA